MAKVHKETRNGKHYSETTLCGREFWETETSWYWKDVTCKQCQKKRGK